MLAELCPSFDLFIFWFQVLMTCVVYVFLTFILVEEMISDANTMLSFRSKSSFKCRSLVYQGTYRYTFDEYIRVLSVCGEACCFHMLRITFFLKSLLLIRWEPTILFSFLNEAIKLFDFNSYHVTKKTQIHLT